MSSTDYLKLSENKFFQHLRTTLQDPKKARSLIAIRDDILYAWDNKNNCIIALNIKTARSSEGKELNYQSLLPYSPPLFTPDRVIVNDSNTLLAACGPNGVLVFELPILTSPYGTFWNNKEINYVRTHSLHERALAFSTKIEVRQVRFHPGSPQDHHVCLLTNDNIFRIFAIENNVAISQGVFHVGVNITGVVPSSQIFTQEALGETAQDFDFSCPEVSQQPKSLTKKDLKWPIYFLCGDGTIYIMTVVLGDKLQPNLYGPHIIKPLPDGKLSSEYCSITIFQTTPPLLAIANCNGHIFHVLALDNFMATENVFDNSSSVTAYQRSPNKVLLLLETLELELGYTIGSYSKEEEYSCPIYIYKDDIHNAKYYTAHECGVHVVEVGCIDSLNKFADEEDIEEVLQTIVNESTSIEYLISTKMSDDVSNPVVGFALYYDVHSYLALLGNGHLVTKQIVTVLPTDSCSEQDLESIHSPLKQILSHQFDEQIQRILKQGTSQPILKLSSNEGKTQQDCYELIQRAAVSLRERFSCHERARTEIEKRVRALILLKAYQTKELNKMIQDKINLQVQAEKLAEKYEDMNEKQEQILSRCQKLLISIAKHQDIPSYAEQDYHSKLKSYNNKMEQFKLAIQKLKKRMLTQEYQLRNHQAQVQKNLELTNDQSESFKASLLETTAKISEMMKEVNEYKNQLNIY